MPATVVLGAQWGDEGKGKLVDQLASTLGWVVRFQGGNNAGHTVVIGDRTIKLHLLPSGITNPEATLILGDGMVIDPWVLQRELDTWADEGGDAPSAPGSSSPTEPTSSSRTIGSSTASIRRSGPQVAASDRPMRTRSIAPA